MYDLKVSRFTL